MNTSKPIIDEIDVLLAKHYGFLEEELDSSSTTTSSTAWATSSTAESERAYQ